MRGHLESSKGVARWGGRLGLGAFIAVVGSFTLLCAFQIAAQVWAPSPPLTEACAPAMGRLRSTLARARALARRAAPEREALTTFRETLGPAWQSLPALRRLCSTSERARLNALEALRFAEENAVRYRSHELTRHRAQVEALWGRGAPEDGGRPHRR